MLKKTILYLFLITSLYSGIEVLMIYQAHYHLIQYKDAMNGIWSLGCGLRWSDECKIWNDNGCTIDPCFKHKNFVDNIFGKYINNEQQNPLLHLISIWWNEILFIISLLGIFFSYPRKLKNNEQMSSQA